MLKLAPGAVKVSYCDNEGNPEEHAWQQRWRHWWCLELQPEKSRSQQNRYHPCSSCFIFFLNLHHIQNTIFFSVVVSPVTSSLSSSLLSGVSAMIVLSVSLFLNLQHFKSTLGLKTSPSLGMVQFSSPYVSFPTSRVNFSNSAIFPNSGSCSNRPPIILLLILKRLQKALRTLITFFLYHYHPYYVSEYC